MIIGTVKGDLHDIGKNLVAMMLEGARYEVIDLGVDVDSVVFIKSAIENNVNAGTFVGQEAQCLNQTFIAISKGLDGAFTKSGD